MMDRAPALIVPPGVAALPKRPPRVAVAVPSPDHVHANFAMALSAMLYGLVHGIQDAWALTANTTGLPGRAIQLTASVVGTATLTLVSGATIVVTLPTGDSIYPYAVTKYNAGTATVDTAYNLS